MNGTHSCPRSDPYPDIVPRLCILAALIASFWARRCTPSRRILSSALLSSATTPTRKKGGLDLTVPEARFANPETSRAGSKVHDRIESGEMPPKKTASGRRQADTTSLSQVAARHLVHAEQAQAEPAEGRTGVRRLTRVEYENTIRDLFDLPGIALQGRPARRRLGARLRQQQRRARHLARQPGQVHRGRRPRPRPGHRHAAQAADGAEAAHLAGQPGGFVAHVLMNGDGVLLKNKKPDPDFPPAGEQGTSTRAPTSGWARSATAAASACSATRTNRSAPTSSSSSRSTRAVPRPHVAVELPVGQGQGAARPRHRGGAAVGRAAHRRRPRRRNTPATCWATTTRRRSRRRSTSSSPG